MLTDDLFEGWLAMPAITGFLELATPMDCQVMSTRPEGGSSEVVIRGIDMSAIPQGASTGQAFGSRSDHSHGTHRTSLDCSGNSSIVPDNSVRLRRGHTKSRLGCITCKKRKIKVCYTCFARFGKY